MPEGQYTGQRQSYIYETDSGEAYVLLLDATLGGLNGTGLVVATAANAAGATPAPKRFKPRVVFWQGTLGTRTVRKQVVCGTVDATLYARDVSQALTIDGAQGSTTGRKGEKLTFVKLGAAADGGGAGG
jgi:pectate lyase